MVTVILGEGKYDVGYGVSDVNSLPSLIFEEVDTTTKTAVEFKSMDVLDDVWGRLASHHFSNMFSFGRAVQVMFMSQESVAGLLRIVEDLKFAATAGVEVSFPKVEQDCESEDDGTVDDDEDEWKGWD